MAMEFLQLLLIKYSSHSSQLNQQDKELVWDYRLRTILSPKNITEQ